MKEILRFLTAYEVWIYVLLGLVAVIYLRKLVYAIHDWQGSIFGLEKSLAQRRLSEATSILLLMLLLGLGEFVLVSFVSPSFPELKPLATPTLSLLSTTPVSTGVAAVIQDGTAAPPSQATLAALSAATGCTPGQIEFTYPAAGETLSGKVTLKGTVLVPSLSFYKYEFKKLEESNWTTIQAGAELRCAGSQCAATPTGTVSPTQVGATAAPNDELGFWDTSQLTAGDYMLQLVVFDNQGKAYPACVVPIKVAAPKTQ